jgi:ribonuclease P protein component
MLKKTFRLSATKDIKTTFLRGRSFFSPYFVVRYAPPQDKADNKTRFAIIASTKVSKHAVKRNRVKRILRETIRAELPQFRVGDYIVITKARAIELSPLQVSQTFNSFMEKIRLKQ